MREPKHKKHAIYGVYTVAHKRPSVCIVTHSYLTFDFRDVIITVARIKKGKANIPENFPKDNWITVLQGLGFTVTEKKIDELA
jgi:hypothetical protein